MPEIAIASPDVTLLLDLDGTIREVTLGGSIVEAGVDALVGRRWVDTVTDSGGDKVRRMVQDARARGVSAFRQLNQCFPSGTELLVEYTTVRLGESRGLMAIGKSLHAVAELQSRLIAAQQAMERDYWKLRQVETRYRLLLNAANEALVLLDASDLRVVEVNPAAVRALGGDPQRPQRLVGRELLPEVATQDQEALQTLLTRVREQGKAPGILVHLGRDREACMVRASLMTSESGLLFLLQLAPVNPIARSSDHGEPASIESLVARSPDGFAVIDQDGRIVRANRAFLDLVQIGAEGAVIGERLSRWLGRAGADLAVLIANVRRHGAVRLFSTTLHGTLGTDVEVEISAVGDADGEPERIGLILRDVGRRLSDSAGGQRLGSLLGALTERIGKTPLRDLVRDAVSGVERHYVEASLELTNGNRTAAAELLGLSRQSLYAKLKRYGLEGDGAVDRKGSAAGRAVGG
jgi:transcriptional regulator PpsR